MNRLAALALAVAAAAAPSVALAWGNTGHRIVGELAMEALPVEVPAFLRTPQAVTDVGELSREPDRSKGSGKIHDHDREGLRLDHSNRYSCERFERWPYYEQPLESYP